MHYPSPFRLQVRLQRLGVTTLLLLLAASAAHAQGITVHGTDAPRAQTESRKESLSTEDRVAAGELPASRLYSFADPETATTVRLPPLTEKFLKQQQSTGKRNLVGVTRDLPQPIAQRSDTTTFDAPEGTLSIVKIVAEGARQIRVRFTDVNLPKGARLFVYSPTNPAEVYGAFTGRGASDTGDFWTPPVEGDAIIIEYVAPPSASATGERLPFVINEIGHIFRDARDASSSFGGAKSHESAGACNLSIPEEWKEASRSVGLIQFVSTDGVYICTGTLLNSRNNDLTPYFLTANHCINTPSEAQSANIRWFYDSPTASTLSSYGAALLSTGAATDYTLLMINGTLPPGLRWAGWTTTNPDISSGVTGIHHPKGSYKRISFGNLINSGCPSNLPGACENFHKVRWNSGTTEGGSSGSGIWTGSPADPLLVGTLWGGAASCEDLSGTDYYGRFDVTYPLIASFLEGSPDDGLEDNDTRDTARLISSGSWSKLVVKRNDEDWYRVSVPAGATATHRISYTRANGDAHIVWFDPNPFSSTITYANTADSRTATVKNTSDRTTEFIVRVYLIDAFRNTYDMNLDVSGGCSYSISPSSRTAASGGDNGTVTITTAPECNWTANESINSGWISLFVRSGKGSATIRFSVSPNFVAQPRTGTLLIGGQTFTVTQEGFTCSYNVTPTPRSFGQSGGIGRANVDSRMDVCKDWSARSNADWISIIGASSSAEYGIVTGALDYSVAPNATPAARTGSLTVAGRTVTITQAAADSQWQPTTLSAEQVQFKSWQYQGRVYAYTKLVFPDTGYRVADWGQALKSGGTFTVDVKIERLRDTTLPVETSTAQIYDLGISSHAGYTFVLRSSANAAQTFSFTSTSGALGANPLDVPRDFVRQQYLDFLSREPDVPGSNHWTGEITTCGADANCTDRKRVNTSGAFFLSLEHQATGYYVYRLYQGALDRQPYLSEFTSDARKVADGIVVDNALSVEKIEANKAAFAREFVERAEFQQRYGTLDGDEFVARLAQTTQIELTPAERAEVVAAMQAAGETLGARRALAVQRIVDGMRTVARDGGVVQLFETRYGRAFYEREYNRAFVLMQYFGYLRRDPDAEGYAFWLNKLTNFNGDFTAAQMVRAFILSSEYRSRFGQP